MATNEEIGKTLQKRIESLVTDQNVPLKDRFAKTAIFVDALLPLGLPGIDQNKMLEFYGLYKLAIFGPCIESEPSILQQKARVKWGEWKKQYDAFKKDKVSAPSFEIQALEKYISFSLKVYKSVASHPKVVDALGKIDDSELKKRVEAKHERILKDIGANLTYPKKLADYKKTPDGIKEFKKFEDYAAKTAIEAKKSAEANGVTVAKAANGSSFDNEKPQQLAMLTGYSNYQGQQSNGNSFSSIAQMGSVNERKESPSTLKAIA